MTAATTRPEGDASARAAVLGSPVSHSLSPVLHNAAYRALGLGDWVYGRHAVGGPGEPTLRDFLAGLGSEWAGLSLTMPLKEDGLSVARSVSERARRVEAANTLLPVPGGWHADSTDGVGISTALIEAGTGQVGRCLLLGAGATARSALDALARLGCAEVVVAVRDRVRPETRRLSDRLGLRLTEGRLTDLGGYLQDADVVVSTLPGGVVLPLPGLAAGALTGTVVLDVVYAGWPTPLATWAQTAGATVVSGRDMLLHQAAEQVRLMTGRTAPVAAMREALEGRLRSSG